MNKVASKLTLLAGALAVSCLFAAPTLRAADEKVDPKVQAAADRQAKHDADVLKKYDKNGNGILDPEEQALLQANQEKMRVLREAKKKKAADRATAAPKPVDGTK